MRILVTGGRGLLGSALVPLLDTHETRIIDIQDGDVADPRFVRAQCTEFAPQVIVHLAAFTDVDGAEARVDEAFRVNAEGSRVVAQEAERAGASVVMLSTDYVFDGRGQASPYREDDTPRPLSVYGRSKLAGEEAVRGACTRWAIVRSAWLYGAGGKNFVDTIARHLRERDAVSVVDDQVGSPTWAGDLARGLVSLIADRVRGTVHLVNGGHASWYTVACEVARRTGIDPARVHAIPTAALGRPAPRPSYSVLDTAHARDRFGIVLRPWEEALAAYLRSTAAPMRPKGTV